MVPVVNTMRAIKNNLSSFSFGRVILHLWALSMDGKVRWHVSGILREVW